MSDAVIDPADYLAEAEIEGRWPVLKSGEIRRARKAGAIEFFAFATGPRYTPGAVQDYIDHKYRRKPTIWSGSPLQQPQPNTIVPPSDGSSEDSILMSHIPSGEGFITPAAMTPEFAMSVAEASAQRIAMKRGRRSSRSSQPRQPARSKNALTLVKS